MAALSTDCTDVITKVKDESDNCDDYCDENISIYNRASSVTVEIKEETDSLNEMGTCILSSEHSNDNDFELKTEIKKETVELCNTHNPEYVGIVDSLRIEPPLSDQTLNPYRCYVCDQSFASQDYLYTHLLKHKDIGNEIGNKQRDIIAESSAETSTTAERQEHVTSPEKALTQTKGRQKASSKKTAKQRKRKQTVSYNEKSKLVATSGDGDLESVMRSRFGDILPIPPTSVTATDIINHATVPSETTVPTVSMFPNPALDILPKPPAGMAAVPLTNYISTTQSVSTPAPVMLLINTTDKRLPAIAPKLQTKADEIAVNEKIQQLQQEFWGRIPPKPRITRYKSITDDDFDLEQLRCNLCEKKYGSKKYLLKHMAAHTESTTQSRLCKVCGKVMGSICAFRRHMQAHEDDRPFKCEEHNKGFYHKKALIKHMNNVHTADRPHVCSTCGHAFSQREHLTVHERIHDNTPRSECSVR